MAVIGLRGLGFPVSVPLSVGIVIQVLEQGFDPAGGIGGVGIDGFGLPVPTVELIAVNPVVRTGGLALEGREVAIFVLFGDGCVAQIPGHGICRQRAELHRCVQNGKAGLFKGSQEGSGHAAAQRAAHRINRGAKVRGVDGLRQTDGFAGEVVHSGKQQKARQIVNIGKAVAARGRVKPGKVGQRPFVRRVAGGVGADRISLLPRDPSGSAQGGGARLTHHVRTAKHGRHGGLGGKAGVLCPAAHQRHR